ncbi:hypothetical protein [Pseudomonas sp. 6D_7.1_Bac1]|uniref:hypothetical protein n=1 Tax=Pseudomonas sp. 6D_7.1_Bac1 TaxID=2971615 RepID=UPI0021C727B8|nr:hypothetical protein [Pseudomonas sp. 6D_7.1_Bac1]MCU1751981.1 hypothetical protein [Pseudomonas sp. 6D_7.1_Bac1]
MDIGTGYSDHGARLKKPDAKCGTSGIVLFTIHYQKGVNMTATKHNIISAIKVVVIFTILTSGAYVTLIPALNPSYKTSSILVVGVVTSALTNGYVGYQVAADEILPIKIGFSFCYAIVTTILVSLLSLFIILNIRGA